jgi:2-C-methyl-D-erythritol 4-phosphate cytidylyltransferase
VFRAEAIRRAHEAARDQHVEGTDDASLVERIGGTVAMIEGPRWNMKITVPEDLEVAEALLSGRGRRRGDSA